MVGPGPAVAVLGLAGLIGLLREAEMYTFALTDDETKLLLIAVVDAQVNVQSKINYYKAEKDEGMEAAGQRRLDKFKALEATIRAEMDSQRKPRSEQKPEG
jgi:hypothetical protein